MGWWGGRPACCRLGREWEVSKWRKPDYTTLSRKFVTMTAPVGGRATVISLAHFRISQS